MNKEQDFRNRLAKIQSMIAIKNAQIMANPLPYLNDMSARCVELLKVLDKVEHALSPDLIFDMYLAGNFSPPLKPMDIQGEALFRCNAAKKILNEYRNG